MISFSHFFKFRIRYFFYYPMQIFFNLFIISWSTYKTTFVFFYQQPNFCFFF